MNVSVYILSTLFIMVKLSKVEVHIKQGIIFGVREMTVFEQKWYFAFYGVPYAKAPIGKLRFQDPKPLKKFVKPFDATMEYHGACAQAHIVHKHVLYGFEDCLHLNIYTPFLPKDKNERLKPVIVWIHGYAFTSSFSHIYGPDFLIEHDILFISLTHRIGPFGFLKVNDSNSSDNMGLKDMITGLNWIRSNVKYFGGDKNQITLMGSGSGGSFALLLLLTKYRKLFQKLIIQSGTMFSPSIYQGFSTLEWVRLQNELKKAGHKNYARAPTRDVVAATPKIYSPKDIINFQRPLVPFTPVIEQDSTESLLSKLYITAYENERNDDYNIPILTGFTSQESISEIIPFIHYPSYLKSLGAHFKYLVPFSTGCAYNYSTKSYSSIANKIIQQYFRNYPDISLKDFLLYTSDIHRYPIYKFIKTHLKSGNRKLFVYKFNYNGKFNAVKLTSLAGLKKKVKGAAQGDEICYILKCEPLWENYVKIKSDIHNEDRKFIKQIATLWANFAKFGNPTPSDYNDDVTWLPMTSKNDNMLLLDKRSRIVKTTKEAKMYDFWNNLYDDYYSPVHCNHQHDEL